MKSSLTSRLILFISLSAGAILVLGLVVDYRLSRSQMLERLVVDAQRTVAAVVRDLEQLLQGVENSTRLLGSILAQQALAPGQLERLLREAVNHNDVVFGAAIALQPRWTDSPRGFAPYYYKGETGLSHSDFTAGDTPYWERPWYRIAATSGEPAWTEPYFDSGGAEVYMATYAMPVLRRAPGGSELYAVVTADITLEELHRYLQRLQLGEHGIGLLVSDSGLVLNSRASSTRMSDFGEQFQDPESARPWRDLFRRASAGHTTMQHLQCQQFPGDCVVGVTRLRHTGWTLGVVVFERELLAPLRTHQLRSLAVGLLCLLALALVVSLVTRRITRPLGVLARSADEFGAGNFDAALPRVKGDDEVARLVRSFSSMKGALKQYIADLKRATASRSRLEGELSAAREIQMSMLPQRGEACERGEGYSLWATVRPARSVGGDLFTYSLLGRQLNFAVGDVSDKGVPAALFMARALSKLQQLSDALPGAMLAELNNALVQRNDNCMFLTLLLGSLDLDSRQLTFASAGHPPPLLLRDGQVSSVGQRSGPATGLAPDQVFPDNHLQLAAGDRLAVYTDGIDEAFDGRGEMFGTGRLAQHLEASQRQALDSAGSGLRTALDEFCQPVPQSDDITLLLLEIAAAAQQFQASFPMEAGVAGRCARWLHGVLPGTLTPATERDLQLVLEEAVTNIQKYAGLTAGDPVEVALVLDAGEAVLRVSDPGDPFDPLREGRRAELGAELARAEPGGLGLHLMVRLTDWQRYRREAGWNRLELGRRLRVPAAPAGPPANPPGGAAHEEEQAMKLSTSVDLRPDRSLARIHLKGALNSETAPQFERQLQEVLSEGMGLTVLDMRELDYISSAGLRVIFKAAKHATSDRQRLAASNRKPHIEKVFEILKALPDMAVFANEQELEDYLEAMQAGGSG